MARNTYPPARILLLALLTLAIGLPAAPVAADPPDWAPAHGWRAKHGDDDGHKHKKGKHDDDDNDSHRRGDDYGVMSGRCNRDAVGAVVGGAVGGVIGSRVGKGDSRTVAILVGTVTGALIGYQIGRDMDKADRGCFGQTLEMVPDRQSVTWKDADGRNWKVTPTNTRRDGGKVCRDYTSRAVIGSREESVRGRACRQPDGSWRVVT